MSPMGQTVTKKFRFSPEKAQQLRRVAREARMTETDVVREGVDLFEEKRKRAEATERLIALIEGPEPKKIRFRLK